MRAGLARFLMLSTACSMLSMPPRMVLTSFMAVVCIGMASLKWRTSSTRPKDVQPWEPCIIGMVLARPRKA